MQFVGTVLPADIRITRPDIRASGGTRLNTREFSFPAETEITVNAIFYNMGISSASNVAVHLTDLTEVTVLDSDTISFSGLPTSGYQCDRDTVSFTWQTDSDDIGLHLLRVNADPIAGEQDTSDNSTQVLFRITPRDYAETVLGDSWDMDETSSSPPAWFTDDVISLSGYTPSFTDSITGMFEATITNPTSNNKLELNLGSDSTDYIPSRQYDQFSMIAKAETELTVTLWWDAGGRTRYLELDDPIGTTWGEIGPFDLTDGSSDWADEDVEELWLEFESSSSSSPADIRIGWIKLTESHKKRNERAETKHHPIALSFHYCGSRASSV